MSRKLFANVVSEEALVKTIRFAAQELAQ